MTSQTEKNPRGKPRGFLFASVLIIAIVRQRDRAKSRVPIVNPGGRSSRRCWIVFTAVYWLDGCPQSLRFVCRYGNAGLLRPGGPQPLVHFGVCRSLRFGLRLRLPARRMAVRDCRGDLGVRCWLSLVVRSLWLNSSLLGLQRTARFTSLRDKSDRKSPAGNREAFCLRSRATFTTLLHSPSRCRTVRATTVRA
jgi:hypothetical protein